MNLWLPHHFPRKINDGMLPIATNFDYNKLIFNTDTTLNLAKIPCKAAKWCELALQKIGVSSANKRWDTVSNILAKLPTEKLESYPNIAATSNVQLKASMTISKSSGDNEPLWWTPLVLPKKSTGIPLIGIVNLTVDIHHIIHLLHFFEKPHRLSKFVRKFQFTWS